ncbi:acyltransferase domain-containing protein, partial [Streptomyces sodiiphilus]|uniref:acyltransferase domain-containing protein n=1 Tax=Streptomyces sodiiphilus TaxID=226217 RepID=UPI003CD0A776
GVGSVGGVVPWVVSGRGVEGLRGQAERLRGWVESGGGSGVSLVDVGYSLVVSRSVFSHRAVVVGSGVEELVAGLDSVVSGGVGDVVSGGKTAFLFTGQGAQRLGMGRELYEAFPVFAEVFDEVCGVLDGCLGSGSGSGVWSGVSGGSVRGVVFGEDAGLLDRTVFAQCGLFAFEVALFRLMESWGVVADFVVGHSVGELVAAHVSGVLSLSDACVLVAARGRLMQGLPEGGAMVSLALSEGEVVGLLEGCGGRVGVAAVNGPLSTVVSGEEGAVLEVAERSGVKWRRLRVSHAFHSPLMEGMLEEFGEVAGGLSFGVARIPVVSNVSGELAGEELGSAGYWVRHVREAVRFEDGLRVLERAGVSRFVEVGPAGVLSGMGAECVPGGVFVPLVRKGRGEVESVVAGVGRVHGLGGVVDWEKVFAGSGACRVQLPTYAFQRQRYW